MTSKDKGLRCRSCRKLIPWKKLAAVYEVDNGDVLRNWVCECGNVLRTDNMEDLQVKDE